MAQGLSKALTAAALRAAHALPDVETGIACEGTPVESRTFKVNTRAFLFLRPGNLMLKLGPSLPQAAKLAAKHPGIRAGAGGWITLTGSHPTPAILARWVKESYQLMAGDGGATTLAKPPSKRRRAAKAPGAKPRR